MLVLTRKLNEQILIGDDIKITLLRVRGNTVRLGIEAPRDRRIIRGELEIPRCSTVRYGGCRAPSRRTRSMRLRIRQRLNRRSRKTSRQSLRRLRRSHKIFVGTVKKNGEEAKLRRPAPLSEFRSSGLVDWSCLMNLGGSGKFPPLVLPLPFRHTVLANHCTGLLTDVFFDPTRLLDSGLVATRSLESIWFRCSSKIRLTSKIASPVM